MEVFLLSGINRVALPIYVEPN